MKQYVVTASEMKRYDANTIEKYKVPSLLLMERAALATVEELQHAYGDRPCRVLVVAGCGNNGGDGLAVGRLLMLQGYKVTCTLLGSEDRCTEETARQISILREYGMHIFSTIQNDEYDIVIDAIFGVGLSRPAKSVFRDAIEWINVSDAYVCSVDIPSGVQADTGEVMGCAVYADLTVTYGFRKLGHILYPGAGYVGRLACRQMGIDERSFLGEEPIWYTHIGPDSRVLPARRPDGNKGTFGKALLIVGNENIAGAAMMAAKSAFRIGTGMVKIVTSVENREALLQYVPEAMLLTYLVNTFSGDRGISGNNGNAVYDGSSAEKASFMEELTKAETWADCILIGPGIGTDRRAYELLRFGILESTLPLVIDADGLNLLSEDKELKKAVADQGGQGRTIILTPHLGEFARLYGCSVTQAKEHLTEYPSELSMRLQSIVVCKDARTVVVCPGIRSSYVNTTGNAGMATAGSGDVLAGMIAGLLAQRMPGMDAAVTGVYLHGFAGDLAAGRESETAMTATDIIECIGDAVLMQPGKREKNF